MENLQRLVDQNPTGNVNLAPGEYEGPLHISRAGVLDGNGATLWVTTGPALVLATDGITLRNWRIEVVGDPDADVAIDGNGHSCTMEKVEIHGVIRNIPGLEGQWKLPGNWEIGAFSADEENMVSLPIDMSEGAEVDCRIDGVHTSTNQLMPGKSSLMLTIEAMRAGTILYGELLFHVGGIVRRLYVSGRAVSGAPRRQEVSTQNPQPFPSPVRQTPPDPAPLVRQHRPGNSGSGSVSLLAIHGQRTQVKSDSIEVTYTDVDRPGTMDIDVYVFQLYEDGRTRGDEDLFFFGNRGSEGTAISLSKQQGNPDKVQIDLSKVPPSVQHIVVSYAIYDDGIPQTFQAVQSPLIHVQGAGTEASFALTGLSVEKTVVALEFYRRNQVWKVHFVGAGYAAGLRRLCEDYGLDVE